MPLTSFLYIMHSPQELLQKVAYPHFEWLSHNIRWLTFPKKLIIRLVNVEADPKLPYIAMWWNPPKLYRKKAPQERERKWNKGQGPKSGQANSSTKAGPLGGNGTTKNQTIAMSIWKLVWYWTFLEIFHTSLGPGIYIWRVWGRYTLP